MSKNENVSGVILTQNETSTSIDYFSEWRNKIAQEWVKDYFLGKLKYCNELKAEYDGEADLKFTVMTEDVEVTLSVNIDGNQNVVGIEEPTFLGSFEPEVVFTVVFNVAKRWQELRAAENKTFQLLKFLPKTYSIKIEGNVDQITVARLTKNQYDYWLSPNADLLYLDILIEDNEVVIPDKMKILEEDGDWTGDDVFYTNFGAVYNQDIADVSIYDEKGNQVFNCLLNEDDLAQFGISTKLIDTFNIENHPNVFQYAILNFEADGLFLGGDVELTEEFDPQKLSFECKQFDGNDYVVAVFYDGIAIKEKRSSTSGYGIRPFFCKVL